MDARLNEIKNKISLLENALQERGGSELLYHFTSITSIKSMLQNNGKNGGYFSLSLPKKVDQSILNRETPDGKGKYTHYLSLTRSPNANWGYVKALDKDASYGSVERAKNDEPDKKQTKKDLENVPHEMTAAKSKTVSPTEPDSVGSARITFDGKALSAGRVIKPVDFFGPYVDEKGVKHDYNDETASGTWASGDPNKMSMLKQAEDRVYAYTYDFDGILNYITRIDIYAKEGSSSLAEAKEVLRLAKMTPVEGKIHIYTDFKYYNRPDYERIKNAASKKGISASDWRPEVTDNLPSTEVKRAKQKSFIEESKATNLAVLVWVILFAERYRKFLTIKESNNGLNLNFRDMFSRKDVVKTIKSILSPIRSKKYNKKIYKIIINKYYNLTNADIARYCFIANPKFESLSGISKALINSIYDIIYKKFGLDDYRKLFRRVSNILKKVSPTDDVVAADKDVKQNSGGSAMQRPNDAPVSTYTGKERKKPVKTKKADADDPKKYDRVVVPKLSFNLGGKPISITNVGNIYDAIKKLSKASPGTNFGSEAIKSFIEKKLLNAKKELMNASKSFSLNEEDIENMVAECVNRILSQKS